jgi:hypothetical protein
LHFRACLRVIDNNICGETRSYLLVMASKSYFFLIILLKLTPNMSYKFCCFTVHFDKFKVFFCQQMPSLLKHKMLHLTLKISLYMAPTCFGPFGPSSGSIRRNIAKVTFFVEIISKNTSLKLLLCSGNKCFGL